jgi:energy-coupling factor transporter ATP-binding protein EcfA2
MYIKSVTLENVKGFRSLSFDFERSPGTFAGWTVFVGGNASGKSTILKSMALAIVGPDASRELLGNSSSWRGWLREGERRAEVTLAVTWDQSVDRFRKGGANPGRFFDAGMRFTLEGKGTANDRDEVPLLRPIYKLTARRGAF